MSIRPANYRRSIGRLFSLFSLALIALAIFSTSAAELQAAAARPNIIFLMADDMGYGDLGCYNKDSKIPTPNMDRLAREGMRFTDAHSPSAVCTPTRYGVLTGRYCWRTSLKRGVLWGLSPLLIDTKRLTVPALLKKNGYATACVGKWHLGLGNREKTDYGKPLTPGPLDVGFDYFFGIPASLDMEPYVYVENDRVLELPTETTKASKRARDGGGGFWRGGPIAPGFRHIDVLPKITEKAVAYIERHNKKSPDQPFFLYFPLSAPHTPWVPTKEFAGKSKAGVYGDFTNQVDWTVGQVLMTLDRLKLTDNTLIVVTSDNGSHWIPADIKKWNHRANGALRGQKADIWEGGHRVPYLVRWPGKVAEGSVCGEVTCHTDLLATAAAIVGAEVPNSAGEDSYNMLPALLGHSLKKPIRDSVVHHSVSGVFAIRQGSWKLILGRGSAGFSKPRVIKPKPGEPVGQLYNLADDLGETKNLYQQHPEIVKRLTALLEKQKKQGYSHAR